MNLYEISDRYAIAVELYNNAENDDELAQAEAMLIEAEGDLVDKAENYAKFIKNLEAEEKAYKEEAKRLNDKAKSATNKIKWLKGMLQDTFEVQGVDKIKGDIFTVALQNNPPSLDLTDDAEIPEEFYEPQPAKLKSRELLKHIKDTGEVFPGVGIKQGQHIRIR